jgi:hypothetical protein
MPQTIVRSFKVFYSILAILGVGCAFYLEFVVIDRTNGVSGLHIMQQYIQEGSYLPDVELVKEIIRFLFNIVSTP